MPLCSRTRISDIMPTRKRTDLTDAIQEACIQRAAELGISHSQIATELGDLISADHTLDYLSRRKSMGSHLLQHLLARLGLTVTTADKPAAPTESNRSEGRTP
jgi:hypothetical protein